MTVFAVLLLVGAAVAPPTSVWRIEGKPGAIIRLTAKLKSGDKLIADGMIADENYQEGERAGLTRSSSRSHTCVWAKAVRPFTRLRRFARNGHLVWEWRVDRVQQALRLQSTGEADCLSPDGGRLTVTSYRFNPAEGDPITVLGDGVIAVDRRPRFVGAKGARMGQEYGERHATQLVGWRRGSPATLLFEVVTDVDAPGGPKVTPDFVVLAGKR